MLPGDVTIFIKSTAKGLGFDHCRIAKAERLDKEARDLEKWLSQRHHGEMSYMANHFELRIDPTKLVDNAKSIITLAYNYFPATDIFKDRDIKISKYAYGRDYHKVVRKKLEVLLRSVRDKLGNINGRVFVDSAPIMEKTWGKKAGLGWVGKHTNLINRNTGSFFFIATIIIDHELVYDSPIRDYCGTCTRCIDACPTGALDVPYQINASKCISYLTIEMKKSIPEHFMGQMEGWAFGCDICQDVCPWNSFSKPHKEPDFAPNETLGKLTAKEWGELSAETFDYLFTGSALKRTKYEGLQRNIKFILSDQE